ncbi:MAG: hypothetical protein U0228_31505 [Myxococcaceae bacterium]
MATDRELRDELERLFTELKTVKAELAAPAVTVESERQRLVELTQALEQQRTELETRRSLARQRITEARGRRHLSAGQLDDARSKVAELENLGNPLDRQPMNWESPDSANGCGLLVLAMVCGALVAAGWAWS